MSFIRRKPENLLTDASHSPAATAAALPPELPPAERPSLSPNGLMTGPWTEYLFNELSKHLRWLYWGLRQPAYPIPNSSQFVLPTTCAPAVRRSCTTVASYGEENSGQKLGPVQKGDKTPGAPLSMRDEHVVGMSEVHMLSFTATAIPDKGPSGVTGLGLESSARCTKALILALRDSASVAYVPIEVRMQRSLPHDFGSTCMN